MKTVEEIIAYIAHRIGYIYYHRPLMYGGTAHGVDTLLHYYHELWAEIVDRQDEFRRTSWGVHAEEDCDAASFPTRYARNHPDAKEAEIADYAVRQWRKISERLGVPIPHQELKREFADPT